MIVDVWLSCFGDCKDIAGATKVSTLTMSSWTSYVMVIDPFNMKLFLRNKYLFLS